MNDMSATATRLLLFGLWRENPGRAGPAEVIEISPDLSRLSRDRTPGRSAATLQPSIALPTSLTRILLSTPSRVTNRNPYVEQRTRTRLVRLSSRIHRQSESILRVPCGDADGDKSHLPAIFRGSAPPDTSHYDLLPRLYR